MGVFLYTGHVGLVECCRGVSIFSTLLSPLIMISSREAAPSRYQHIISGLVQPLNHTRHKNPLVSVTFSPTQAARSQSAIWMLWSLSSHFPLWLVFLYPMRYFQTLPYHYLACICCILCISICVWAAISLHIISLFYQLHRSKNIFFSYALVKKMYSIQGNLVAEKLTVSWVSYLKQGRLWWDN